MRKDLDAVDLLKALGGVAKLDWARTSNEDIHESVRALLPVTIELGDLGPEWPTIRKRVGI